MVLTVACMDDALRLSDGRNELEGRVEVCMDGVWGTVCNDLWSMENTAVVCNQLGFGKWNLSCVKAEILLCCIGNRGYYINRLAVGTAKVSILLTGVQCYGNESRLVDCPQDATFMRCNHNEDVRVVCIPADTPPGKSERFCS